MPDQTSKTSALTAFTFAGRHFVLDGLAGTDQVARQMTDGSYEAPLPMLVMATLARRPGVFLDVGANNGIYSILAAKTRDEVRVLAFEPNPPVADVLQANVDANGLQQQITIHRVGLSNRAGSFPLYLPDAGHGLLETSASLEIAFTSRTTDQVVVRTVTLDETDCHGRISAIKVDIEGHEAAFLQGGYERIKNDTPIIFAEMLPPAAHDFARVAEMFRGLNYLMFRLRATCVIACDRIEHDHLAWNYGFVHKSDLTLFRDCCRTHGLEMYRFFDA